MQNHGPKSVQELACGCHPPHRSISSRCCGSSISRAKFQPTKDGGVKQQEEICDREVLSASVNLNGPAELLGHTGVRQWFLEGSTDAARVGRRRQRVAAHQKIDI